MLDDEQLLQAYKGKRNTKYHGIDSNGLVYGSHSFLGCDGINFKKLGIIDLLYICRIPQVTLKAKKIKEIYGQFIENFTLETEVLGTADLEDFQNINLNLKSANKIKVQGNKEFNLEANSFVNEINIQDTQKASINVPKIGCISVTSIKPENLSLQTDATPEVFGVSGYFAGNQMAHIHFSPIFFLKGVVGEKFGYLAAFDSSTGLVKIAQQSVGYNSSGQCMFFFDGVEASDVGIGMWLDFSENKKRINQKHGAVPESFVSTLKTWKKLVI